MSQKMKTISHFVNRKALWCLTVFNLLTRIHVLANVKPRCWKLRLKPARETVAGFFYWGLRLIELAKNIRRRIAYRDELCAVVLYPSGKSAVIAESETDFNRAIWSAGYAGAFTKDVPIEDLVEELEAAALGMMAWRSVA
jgi:hypothetical protein